MGLLETALILTSVGSAVGGIASSASANNTNRRIADQTNKTNLQLAREQQQYDAAMWEKNNEYNKPANQVARLKEAGLSDAAASQSVAGIASQPVQSTNLANQQIGNPMMPIDFSGLNTIGMARELANLKKDEASASIEQQRAGLETPLLLGEINQREYAIKLAQQEFEFKAKTNKYSARSMKYAAKFGKYHAEAEKYVKELARIQVDRANYDFGFVQKKNEKELDELTQRIRNLEKEGKNLDLQGNQIKATTENIQQSTENLQTQNEGQKIDNTIKELQKILIEAGQPESVAMRVGALYGAGKVSLETIANSISSMKAYIKSGYKILDCDDDTKDFLELIFDEGKSASKHLKGLQPWWYDKGLNFGSSVLNSIGF